MRTLLVSTALACMLGADAASAEDSCLDAPPSEACGAALQNYWNERPHLSKKEGFVTPLWSWIGDDGRDDGDLTFMMKGIPGVSLQNLNGPVGFKFTIHFSTGG